MKRRLVVPTIALCAAGLASGCRSVPRTADVPLQPVAVEVTLGTVVHVNPRLGFVIVRCTGLPSADEEGTVWRDAQAVGRLKITGPRQSAFVAADVLDGGVQEEDVVRVVRWEMPAAGGVRKE